VGYPNRGRDILKLKQMPDITMCKGQVDNITCPYKDNCYRYNAKPDIYQSYFVGIPLENNKCDFYWGDNGKNIWNQLEEIIKINNK
jgi:hypothetical protein